jgi:hypothetical protein
VRLDAGAGLEVLAGYHDVGWQRVAEQRHRSQDPKLAEGHWVRLVPLLCCATYSATHQRVPLNSSSCSFDKPLDALRAGVHT